MSPEEREAKEQEVSKLQEELVELRNRPSPRGRAEKKMDHDWPIESRQQRIRDLENQLRKV
jgi:hypothetical protein